MVWAWLRGAGVLALGGGGALVGLKLSRLRWPLWLVGYLIALALIALVVLARRPEMAPFIWPLSWLARGRCVFVLVAVGATLLLTSLFAHIQGRRLRVLLSIVAGLYVIHSGAMPFVMPALAVGQLGSLETRVDGFGVCLQGTGYTCGAASAVTVLRALGVPAEEGELAIASHTSGVYGVQADLLADAIAELYGDYGVTCEYRYFETIADLPRHSPCVVTVKYSFLVDHCIALLGVDEGKVSIGDPLIGKGVETWEGFESRWRHTGIVIRRDSSKMP